MSLSGGKPSKSDCSYDLLLPASSLDCIHIPHLGCLHSSWKRYLDSYQKYLDLLSISHSLQELERVQKAKENYFLAYNSYRSFGGRLIGVVSG